MDTGSYGGTSGSALVASQAGEFVSLVFLVLSLVVLAYLSYRVKTVKSFQFEMFIFTVIVTIAEIPRILDAFGNIQTAAVEGIGLLLHTASMIFLSGFIMIRVLKYFTEGK